MGQIGLPDVVLRALVELRASGGGAALPSFIPDARIRFQDRREERDTALRQLYELLDDRDGCDALALLDYLSDLWVVVRCEGRYFIDEYGLAGTGIVRRRYQVAEDAGPGACSLVSARELVNACSNPAGVVDRIIQGFVAAAAEFLSRHEPRSVSA